jgi:deoxycytidine triphosphate deaminase
MALITGNALDPKKFFKSGDPAIQASSFDLTIGCIFDHEGKKVDGPFTIKPGHMVQVVSAEVFSLSDRVTGHVTYKTTLTKKGIWALTVGIVDPGWEGPVATTLLNFSRADHAIAEGDAFLRVSLFEHDPVPAERMRKAPTLEAYLKDIQKTAASSFPTTFLDSEKIAEAAGDKVLERVRKEALVWVALVALLFTLLQLGTPFVSRWLERATVEVTKQDFDDLRAKMDAMQTRLLKSEQATPPAPAPTQPNPLVVPPNPPKKNQ